MSENISAEMFFILKINIQNRKVVYIRQQGIKIHF